MAHGSRVCPACGRLNSADDKACYSCGKRMPGPLASSALGFLTNFSEDGLPATKLLIGMCIVVYGLMMVSDGPSSSLLGSFKPSTLIRVGALLGHFMTQEPWRVLSAVFVHGSLLHIGMNMLSLMRLGSGLEPHFRSARFMLLYLISGSLGFVCTLWWRGAAAFSVGASGAVFGLLGAFIGALVIRRNPGWQQVFFSNLILAGALSFFAPNIDNAAHVGGFVSGFVLGVLLELERQPRRRDALVTGLALAGVVAAVASIVLSASSPVWKEQRRAEARWLEEAERHRLDSE
jgi:membrane associated rhomboid family serine protease